MEYRIIPVTDFEQNCTLLWCPATRKAAVVDPGGDEEAIYAAAETEGVTVEKVLITHAHIDHAGAAAEVAEHYGVPIEGPQREDQFWIDGLAEQSRQFGFPLARGFTPDRWLEDADRVTVGQLELAVILCPGHTPGHVVFYHAPSRLALVGDVLFRGSIGRSDFPRGNHEDLIHSITKKLLPLGDDVRFIPGHGPKSTFGFERLHNPFLA